MNKTTLNSQKEKHSMLSLRRATGGHAGASAACKISIHALLAESDCRCPIHEIIFQRISIHALLAESDHHHNRKDHPQQDFYPRSPCGERRSCRWQQHERKQISIHALLAESDMPISTSFAIALNFYPRSPCGERL